MDDGTEPQAHRTPKLELRRVPAAGQVAGIILDEQPVKLFTHYLGRRTVACLKHNCPGCDANQEPRWNGYATLYLPSTTAVFVVEMTDACRDNLGRWLSLHRSFRGARLMLSRKGKEKNGSLTCSISPSNHPSETLPEPIDLLDWLLRLWGSKSRGDGVVRDGAPALHAAASRFLSKFSDGQD
jgi:hypothetical protein